MDYKNGRIYVIRNTENDLCYIGSTTQSLSKRLSKHKHDRNTRDNKWCKALREIGVDKFYKRRTNST